MYIIGGFACARIYSGGLRNLNDKTKIKHFNNYSTLSLFWKKRWNMHIRNCHIQKTTASPHRQEEEKESMVRKSQFQNRHHKQRTNLRTWGVSALERSVAKQFATGGLNQVRFLEKVIRNLARFRYLIAHTLQQQLRQEAERPIVLL
jgi:hypothetical protein